MSAIKRLNKKQNARLPAYRDKWISIGLSTVPANRVAAEAAIADCYVRAGLTPPGLVVWADSPTAMIAKAVAVQIIEKLDGDMPEREQLLRCPRKRPMTSDIATIKANAIRDVAGDRYGEVQSHIKDVLKEMLWKCAYGQHDAHWLAPYEFFREECGLRKATDKAVGLIDLAKLSGWWIPYENICFACERPATLHRDERGRLHNYEGAALQYPDGFPIYVVHGVRVPERIIMQPESITAEEIDQEANAEIRRVMINQYGAFRYLSTAGKCIHTDGFGSLWMRERPGDDPLLAVLVVDGTPEDDGTYPEYWLRVHHECRPMRQDGTLGDPQELTALNAVASGYNMTGEEYARMTLRT